MTINPTALAAELAGQQYAAFLAVGNDSGLMDLLNSDQGDTLPPPPYTVQALLLAVGAQGIGELSAAGLLSLLAIAGPTFDFGDSAVVAMVGALLTGANPQTPTCPHCLATLPTLEAPTACTRAEKLAGERGYSVSLQDVAEAQGRGGGPAHQAALAALPTATIDTSGIAPEHLPVVLHAIGLPLLVQDVTASEVGMIHAVTLTDGRLSAAVRWTGAVAERIDLDLTQIVGRGFEHGAVVARAARVGTV